MNANTRILEEISLGEKDVYPNDKFSKEELRSSLDEISKSNEEILKQYPWETMSNDIQDKILKSRINEKKKTNFFSPQYRSYHIAAIAAVFCMALVLPMFISTTKNTVEVSSGEMGIRAKGVAALFLYKQDGQKAIRIGNGSEAKEGDMIQISYVSGGAKFGTILSIDGNGIITRHYPDNGDKAAKLETSGEVPLSFSYQLDDAPSFERFVMFSSEKQFSTKQLVEKLSSLKPEVVKKAKLQDYLPSSVHINDVLLIKD